MTLWLKVIGLFSDLVALFKSWREREAGKREVILEVKENSDAALQEADAASAALRERIAAGGLRDDDGFRRD